jgi:hypothetical protein
MVLLTQHPRLLLPTVAAHSLALGTRTTLTLGSHAVLINRHSNVCAAVWLRVFTCRFRVKASAAQHLPQGGLRGLGRPATLRQPRDSERER